MSSIKILILNMNKSSFYFNNINLAHVRLDCISSMWLTTYNYYLVNNYD